MKKRPGTWLFYFLIPILLYLTFKDFPVSDMKMWIVDIPGSTVIILILFNIFAFSLMGVRWFYLLKLEKVSIPFLKLAVSRLVGFAWSYITPGSQFGGEIFQAQYASSEHITFGTSALALLQDRVLEVFGNILVILFILSFYYWNFMGLILHGLWSE